jgi:hypothetical protein
MSRAEATSADILRASARTTSLASELKIKPLRER